MIVDTLTSDVGGAHKECMEAFVAEEANYAAANWVTGQGCCCYDQGPDVECNPQCPSAHAQIFQCNGRKYKQFCGVHVATDTLRDFPSPSYQSCFQSCVDEPQCNALDYTNQHCWLKKEGADPPPKPMGSKTDDISVIFLP